jgi:hypothetical protein
MPDRNGCPGNPGLEFFRRVLDLETDDATHEINIFRPQSARLAETKPDKCTEQHGEPDALMKQVI